MKKLLVVFASALAAQYVAEKWVLRAPGKSTGFVDVDDSPFGMDDFTRAGITTAIVAVGGWAANKFLGGAK